MTTEVRQQTPVRGLTGLVLVVVGGVVVILTLASFGYGLHRDELYFLVAGEHLAWGYPDQPPIVPLLARLGDAISPGSVWAVRVPATLASAATVLFVALTAREMGASRRGQFLAAVTMAVSGYVLITGHLLITNTPDLCFSAAVGWLAARLIRTGDRRLLVPLGAVIGLGLLTKTLLALLVLAVLLSLVAMGPRYLLRGRWLAAGVAVAALLWLPNLVWQVQHGWPLFDMVGVLAAKAYMGGRLGFVPFQFVLFGPAVSAVWVAGLVRLLRSPQARPFRAFGVAYLGMAVVLLISGGTAYYLAGAYPALVAAGGIAVDGWLTRARSALVAALVAFTALFNAVLGLPIVPQDSLAATPILDMYEEAGEQVGWPRLADAVARAYRSLAPDERARAVLLTLNYGEAGALRRYGPALGLPPVYSGHNGFADWGPPPAGADVAVLVGGGHGPVHPLWTSSCASVRDAGRVDNGDGVPNEEQGQPIRLCVGLTRPWTELWPAIRHLS